MTSTLKVSDLRDKWEQLHKSLNKVGERLASKTAEFPSDLSTDSDFRNLASTLENLRNQVAELKAEVSAQSEDLGSEMKHFYEIVKDYEAEIEVFKKGRTQAFQLYDDLSAEHRELLRAFEQTNDELKQLRASASGEKEALSVCAKEAKELKLSYDALFSECSALKVDRAVMTKKMGALEEENVRLGAFKAHEESDRNDLIEKLSFETKSRNDALVLAEAARSELSRLLVEAETDRHAKQEAEQERDQAVGAVDGLNQVIEELKLSVEEQQGLNKHEVMMRHKIETQLLAVEEENEHLKEKEINSTSELEKIQAELTSAEEQKSTWMEEKDSLVAQIGTLAQHMAKDKQEMAALMESLSAAKKESVDAKLVCDDAVEKARQMERIVNQLIQEKGELEARMQKVEEEKQSVLESAKDVVALKSKLDATASELEEVQKLFEDEKKLKTDASAAREKAEQLLVLKNTENGKLADSLVFTERERDSFSANLEAIQKVVQGERAARAEEQSRFDAERLEMKQMSQTLIGETQLKLQALSSLEAEARSKQEVVRQLEEARKGFEKNQIEFDKMKVEVAALRDKTKDGERELKSKDKEIKQISKSADSATQLQQKAEMQAAMKNDEVAVANEALKNVIKERDAVFAEYEKSEKRREELEKQLREAKQALEDAKGPQEQLKEDLARNERKLAAKEEQVRKLLQSVEVLKEKLEQETELKCALEAKLERMKKKFNQETSDVEF